MRIRLFAVTVAVTAIVLSPSVANAAQRDAAPLLGGNGNGRYIVVLKAGVPPEVVAGRAGLRIDHWYSASITGFSARLTATGLAALRRDPAVRYVAHDGEVKVATPSVAAVTDAAGSGPGALTSGSQSPAPWNLDRIDQRNLPLNNSYRWLSTGRGVRAYVIDTGVRSHPDISGRLLPGYDVIDGDTNADDCNGHGTALAGVIGGRTYGVAKDVNIVPVRVLSCTGSGTYSQVIAGIDWVTRNAVRPATALLALGGSANTALDDAVNRSLTSGVSYAVSAGASNANACNYSPARVAGALTVAASDSTDTRASFSNFGSCVDLYAPGVNITTIWNNGGTNTLSGTSFAAAHVTGVAALYLELHPTATASQVHNAIVASATAGVVRNVPIGTPNRLLYSLLT